MAKTWLKLDKDSEGSVIKLKSSGKKITVISDMIDAKTLLYALFYGCVEG